MNPLKKLIFFISCCGFFLDSSLSCHAQRTSEVLLPYRYIQFQRLTPLINPAAPMSDYTYELTINRAQKTGHFFRQNYVHNLIGRLKINLSDRKYHALGISFTGDHEGSLLRRNRGYFTYSWHTAIFGKFSLGTGVSLGFMSYTIVPDAAGTIAGFSSFSPDGNAGVWLYSGDFYFGASVNQFSRSKLQPFIQYYFLERHFNCIAGKEFLLQPRFSVKTSALLFYVPGQTPELDVYVEGKWNRIFLAGINYQHRRGVALALGLEEIALKDSRLDIMFTCVGFTPPTRLQGAFTYEVNLAYYFKSQKNKKSGMPVSINKKW